MRCKCGIDYSKECVVSICNSHEFSGILEAEPWDNLEMSGFIHKHIIHSGKKCGLRWGKCVVVSLFAPT